MRSSSSQQRFKVVIAGGGVAALEALLALRELAGDRIEIEIFAPHPTFRHRPLSVTEPFGLAPPRRIELSEIAADHEATFFVDALGRVDTERRSVSTLEGRELDYDALLLAVGTMARDAIPGATTFKDVDDEGAVSSVIDEVALGEARRLAFALPERITWPLGLYELALLASADLAREDGLEFELFLVTPEHRPLEIFGEQASAAVAETLELAGIEMRCGGTPTWFHNGRLEISGADSLDCDRVIALPAREVPSIPGVPLTRGFIATDLYGAVLGYDRVFAAGDSTWFPIKQGGIAAQQADAAAQAIAALAGIASDPQPFRPLLRGALLTGSGPRFLRSDRRGGESVASTSPLWWPPSKLAGRLLAPYLAAKAGYGEAAGPALVDLYPMPADVAPKSAKGRADTIESALESADGDAGRQDFASALHWLEVAESLELYLPGDYERKRASWQEWAGEQRGQDDLGQRHHVPAG